MTKDARGAAETTQRAPELVCPRCSNDRADLLELVAKDRHGGALWFCRVCGKSFTIKT